MPKLGVRIRPAGPDLFHLEIYHGDTHIGDYERTKESEIPRKLGEIKSSAPFLSNAYAKHGKFVVRWNGRDKEIRRYRDGQPDPGRQAQPIDTIPRTLWRWA